MWLLKTIKQTYQNKLFPYFKFFLSNSCKERDQGAEGCKSVSPSPFQMGFAATALDPARDLQRLHTLIINNLAGFNILNDPGGLYYKESAVQENPLQLHKTIMAIREAAMEIDNNHRTYKAFLEREMKYGSRQAPIGDDNYLHLMRGNLGNTSIGNNNTSATSPSSATLPHPTIHHNALNTLDNSPRLFIRNDVLRNSLTNEKCSQY